MSNVYQPKRKELAKVKVVSSTTYSNNRSKFKFIGSVNRGYDCFITTKRNKTTGKCSFIDDTIALTKRSKNELVKFFMDKKNNRRSVAYLVVPKVPLHKKNTAKSSVQKQDIKKSNTPVYDYSKYYDFDERGRIKGSYVDGRFEPD